LRIDTDKLASRYQTLFPPLAKTSEGLRYSARILVRRLIWLAWGSVVIVVAFCVCLTIPSFAKHGSHSAVVAAANMVLGIACISVLWAVVASIRKQSGVTVVPTAPPATERVGEDEISEPLSNDALLLDVAGLIGICVNRDPLPGRPLTVDVTQSPERILIADLIAKVKQFNPQAAHDECVVEAFALVALLLRKLRSMDKYLQADPTAAGLNVSQDILRELDSRVSKRATIIRSGKGMSLSLRTLADIIRFINAVPIPEQFLSPIFPDAGIICHWLTTLNLRIVDGTANPNG
jgi:hypothetical protein